MKIGILTYHQSVNNGAVMQAYSLSKKIKQEFPQITVEIIDYQMKKVNNSYSYKLISYLKSASVKIFLSKCKKLILDPFYLKRLQYRTKVFKNCLDKLPISNKKIVDDGTDEVFRYINDNYDVLVVGSDAIWNYITRGFPNAYLPNTKVNCIKMSYAASCYGMNFLQRPDREQKEIEKSLNDFYFIGVRDTATEDFVRWSECSQKAIHTCDPTAFLDVNDLPVDEALLRKKLEKRGFDFSKPTVGMMGTAPMLKMIRKFYGDKYQIVALYNYVKGADVNLYDLEPYEWAYVFRYFKMTFTTFFHGTLLSLRNGVPVICLALDTEFAKIHTPKTLDVLTRLGFENWYFKTDYISSNFDVIKQKADEFTENDYKTMILDAIDKEAKSFESFKNALEKIIVTEGK